jgi:hypothetical protein
MEITNRFPQELGNLAGKREIPTFPQADPSFLDKKNVKWTALRLDHFPSGVLVYFPSGASMRSVASKAETPP